MTGATLLALCFGLPLSPAATEPELRPKIEYHLRYEPAERREEFASWLVSVEVSGVSPETHVRFELSKWGSPLETDFDYLEVLEADPPLRADLPPPTEDGLFVPEHAERRGKRVELRYRLAVPPVRSDAQQRFGLLPTWSPEYAFGYSWNTLVQVTVDGEPLEGRRTIELEGPDGGTIVTGWSGSSKGRAKATLETAMGNAPIAFGTPARIATRKKGGFAVEVYQFGPGPDVTETVAAVIEACAPRVGAYLKIPARDPYRAFVTDTVGGGMGSDYGLRIGVMGDAPADHAESPWLKAHIAHEVFHDWLGIALKEDNASLVWLKEGFTEYVSQWLAASTGLVERDYFSRRLLELEAIAKRSPAVGNVAFGDPTVVWRDGDGPKETLAYTGAPLLALRMDAELRAAGKPGLLAMFRDWAEGDRTFGHEDVREWMLANGLKELYETSVVGTELPDVAESLALAGYATYREPTDLTYFGLETDGDWLGATVVSVDPEGPAKAAGFEPGDVFTGWFPMRAEFAKAPEGLRAPYRFGLGFFKPGAEGTYVGVKRAGKDLQLPIEPEVLAGAGYHERIRSDGADLDRFFAFPRR